MASTTQDIEKRWVGHLRNSSRRLTCPDCGGLEIHPPSLASFQSHVEQSRDKHPTLLTDLDIQEAFDKIKLHAKSPGTPAPAAGNGGPHVVKRSRKRPVQAAAAQQQSRADVSLRARQEATPGLDEQDEDRRESKKQCSPTSSVVHNNNNSNNKQHHHHLLHHHQQPHRPLTPDRGRGRQTERAGSKPGPTTARKLWMPEDEPLPRSTQALPHGPRPLPTFASPDDDIPEDPSVTRVIRQVETRSITQEQLVAEVKGIYAGLVMVETKCIEVDNAQSSSSSNKDSTNTFPTIPSPQAQAQAQAKSKDSLRQFSNEQWRALIALHRTLLQEHHDFFLASQHPAASPALSRLAAKYAMPARMWRHGIHAFLELLRHNLPTSLEPMLTFIYMAYSMVALLYETVPAFEDTWIECLGDLSRYRMAIEDDDIRDRETWTAVSRHWYSKASDHSPTTGRLYHHLAILARPNALQQVFYYTKSLCVPIPFPSARESVMTLFDPVLSSGPPRMDPIDAAFVRIHAILFSGKSRDQLPNSLAIFYGLLDGTIARTTKGWLESGYYIGISIANSLLGYGSETNVLMRAISPKKDDSEAATADEDADADAPGETFEQTLDFAVRTYEIITRRWGDMNILPYLHTSLVFLRQLCRFPAAMSHVEAKIPWKLTAMMLNYLKQSSKAEMQMQMQMRIASAEFPGPPVNELPRPLPEDHAMRGLIYAEDYFPADWFPRMKDDDKHFELASMVDERRERILWLGRRIAEHDRWLRWDEGRGGGEFFVSGVYDVNLDEALGPPMEVDGPTAPQEQGLSRETRRRDGV